MHKWVLWTITVLLTGIYGASYYYGVHLFLLEIDRTFLTFVLAGGLWIVSLVASIVALSGTYRTAIMEQLEFAVDHATMVGMAGTAIALFVSVFDGIPTPDVMLTTMSFALTTTIAGIFATIVGNQILLQVWRGRRREVKQQ